MSLTPYVHLDTPLRDAVVGDQVELSTDEQHHLRTVLRLRPGAQIVVADGDGVYAQARIGDADVVVTADPTAAPSALPTIGVMQALTKGRKLDEVVRQVCELGAERITAVAAQRSITRLEGEKRARTVQRWEAVARAACEQSRRPTRPDVDGPVPVAAAASAGGQVLVAHPGGRSLRDAVGDLGEVDHVSLAVGPEGGWTDGEVEVFAAAGGQLVGLGPTVLRTEHAAAAGLAVIAATLGRW